MTDRPNVVVVVLDTARADALEPYGAAAGSTPMLADIAQRGAAVLDTFATSNWTLPSHASMLTGLLPRDLGLGQAPGGRADLCRPYVEARRHRLLPAVLQRAGYATRGVSANLWVASWSGFATGFDKFTEVVSERHAHVHDRSARGTARWLLDAARGRTDDGASAALAVIDTWLADLGPAPFFWFVNLVECHSPYLPPRPWSPCGPVGRIRAAVDARRHQTLTGMWGASAGVHPLPDSALRRMRAHYAASVRHLDDWLARLVDRLEQVGRLADTQLIVVSDHGENLGESGRLGHSFWLDDRLIRVPLVSMGPVRLRTGAVTSLRALPRLVAEAVDLADHPWPDDDGLATLAVAQNDALTDATDPRMAQARDSMGLDERAVWRMTTSSTAATDGTLKLVREGDEDWLYDLTDDPGEERPAHVDGRVAAAYGERFRRLRRAVDAAHAGATAGDPPAAPAAAGPPAPPDLAERMRALGYL